MSNIALTGSVSQDSYSKEFTTDRGWSTFPANPLCHCLSYLDDFQSLTRSTTVCRTWKNAMHKFEEAIKFTKQMECHRKAGEIYALLAQEFPANISFGKHFAEAAFKESMKTALLTCTFFDPLIWVREEGNVPGRYNVIKLTGTNYRGVESLPRSVRQQSTSPYDSQGCTPFKMTPFAARTLCALIANDLRIDALMIISRYEETTLENIEQYQDQLEHWSNQSFGDHTAITLLNGLPAGRLQMLKLAGGFSEKTAEAFQKNLPRLLDGVEKIDPLDIVLNPIKPFEPDCAKKVEETQQTYFQERRNKNPDSIMSKRTACIIM